MLWLVTFNDVFVAFLSSPTIQIKKMLTTSQHKMIEQSCRHIRSYFEESSNQYKVLTLACLLTTFKNFLFENIFSKYEINFLKNFIDCGIIHHLKKVKSQEILSHLANSEARLDIS